MKEITAIIQPVRLGPVREALSLVGVTGMTISDVRGVEYRVDYTPKVKLDIVVSESFVDATLDAIIEAARTDNVGDGKIWIKDTVIRVRTGEKTKSP